MSERGWSVRGAPDGRGVLAAYDEQRPDLILLDVDDAAVGAFEVAQRIRQLESDADFRRRLPIIGLSRGLSGTLHAQCLQADFDECIAEPVEPDTFCARLAHLLAPAGVAAASVELLLEDTGGDRALLAELIDAFLVDYQEKLQRLRAALSSSDFPAVERAAHSLKGTMAMFRADRARDRAYELECFGRERRTGSAEELVRRLEGEAEKVAAVLHGERDALR